MTEHVSGAPVPRVDVHHVDQLADPLRGAGVATDQVVVLAGSGRTADAVGAALEAAPGSPSAV